MKVKVIEENRKLMGEWSHQDLLKGRIYDAVKDNGPKGNRPTMFRIVDESGEDYLYPPMLFEVVEE